MLQIDKFSRLKPFVQRHPLILSAVFGALLPLGFAPFAMVIPSLVSLAGILIVWIFQTPKAAGKSGFVYGFAAFLTGTYWIYISVGTFGGAPVWLALIVMLGLVAIMACYYASLGYIITRWINKIHLSALSWVFSIAAAWTLMEWIRGWFLSGFPWFNLGYLSLDNPLAGYAPIGGVYFCTFVWVYIVASLVRFFDTDLKWKILSGTGIVATISAGYFLNQASWTQDYSTPIKVALVQGGISQDQKWLPQQLPKTMELYAQMSLQHAGADLMIWPEAAIPSIRPKITQYLSAVKARLGDDTTLLTGVLDQVHNSEKNEPDIFNGLLAIDSHFNTPDEQAYYKDHLVPFGEYFPVPGFIRSWLRMMNLPYSDITRGGKKQDALELKDLKIGAFICYEDAYTDRVNTMLPEANLLVNISNDAWFGGSMAPHQHLQITRMRALETERPILRSTNNGISAVIDKNGEIVKTVPQFEPHVLRATIQPVKGATPFVMLGNWLIVSLCGMFLMFIGLINRSRQ